MEKTTLQFASASIFAVCGFLFGQLDGLLKALIVFMVLDYATGIIVAVKRKTLSSEVGFKGIAKKIMIMALVIVGHVLDAHVIVGGGAVCRSAVIGFYIANEGISILENAANIGLPLPKKLIDVLIQLRQGKE